MSLSVLVVSGSVDIGGQGIRLVQAFRKHSDWLLRSVVKVGSYLGYPTDLPYRRRELEELYQACDVFHARINFTEYDRLAKLYGPKPVILHGHGSALRGDPNRFIREAEERNAIVIVSTLDLYLLCPERFIWVGAPYDVDWLRSMR